PGVVVVTCTAGASTVQRQPLEQVSHASGRSGGGNVASSSASSLDGLATRLGCQRERGIRQNGFDGVHHTCGQARRQGSAVAQSEHDGLTDLTAVSSP